MLLKVGKCLYALSGFRVTASVLYSNTMLEVHLKITHMKTFLYGENKKEIRVFN